MRQNLHDLLRVKPALAPWQSARHGERLSSRLFPGQRPGHFCIRRVTRFHRDDMTANARADQREIPDDVEDFVPDEFVSKPQRFFTENGITAQDHCVFQAAALDQILLHERLNLFVIDKCPGWGDLALENRRCDFNR